MIKSIKNKIIFLKYLYHIISFAKGHSNPFIEFAISSSLAYIFLFDWYNIVKYWEIKYNERKSSN